MAKLAKKTIQRLAVLCALCLWPRGVVDNTRLHQILCFADQNNSGKVRMFTFRKRHFGRFSNDVSEALNALQDAGRLNCVFDGPTERLSAVISGRTQAKIKNVFLTAFPDWERSLKSSFGEWGSLTTDRLLKKANDDPRYAAAKQNEIILQSSLRKVSDVHEVDEGTAEELADMVDPHLNRTIAQKLSKAVKTPAESVDWRKRYFSDLYGLTA